MEENPFYIQIQRLESAVFPHQLFYKHFKAVSDFLKDISRQRKKFEKNLNLKDEGQLDKLDFQIINCLKSLLLFHSVHCETDLGNFVVDSQDCSVEEKFSLDAGTIDARKHMYFLAKECRTLLNEQSLLEQLRTLILEIVKFCTQFDKLFDGLSSHFARLQLQSSFEYVDYTEEYAKRFRHQLSELHNLSRTELTLDPKHAKDIADYAANFDDITRKETITQKSRRILVYSRILDTIILKYTFLPLYPAAKFNFTHKLYGNSPNSLLGKMKLSEKLDEEDIFATVVQRKSFESLEPHQRATFVHLLQVLSQAEHRNCNILALRGMVSTEQSFYFIFEGFHSTLYNVISQDRDCNDVFTIFSGLARGLLFLHRRNLVHGGLDPRSIFLTMNSDRTVSAKIAFYDVFKIFYSVIERESESFTAGAILEQSWKSLIYLAPELYNQKFVVFNAEKSVFNSSCDIYSLGIIVHQCMAPLFASDTSNSKLRREINQRYSNPYMHSMSLMIIESEKKHKIKYSNAEGDLKRMLDKELVMKFALVVVPLRPELPIAYDQRNKKVAKAVEQMVTAMKFCWAEKDYERATARRIVSALETFSKASGSLEDIENNGENKLQLRRYRGYKLSPDGLDLSQLIEIFTAYFSELDSQVLPRIPQMAKTVGLGLSLEEFSSELTNAYGVGLDIPKIRREYSLNNFLQVQEATGRSTLARPNSTVDMATLRENFSRHRSNAAPSLPREMSEQSPLIKATTVSLSRTQEQQINEANSSILVPSGRSIRVVSRQPLSYRGSQTNAPVVHPSSSSLTGSVKSPPKLASFEYRESLAEIEDEVPPPPPPDKDRVLSRNSSGNRARTDSIVSLSTFYNGTAKEVSSSGQSKIMPEQPVDKQLLWEDEELDY